MLNFFFFNDTATTEIYTLSLHDALPISPGPGPQSPAAAVSVIHGPDISGPKPRRTTAGSLTYRGTLLSNLRRCQRPRLLPGALACRRPGRRSDARTSMSAPRAWEAPEVRESAGW